VSDEYWIWGTDATAPRILHSMIRVADLERSLAFYCGTLGMRVLSRVDVEAGRFSSVFISFAGDYAAPAIELTWNWDHPANQEGYSHGSGYGHVAIGIPDLHGFCAQLAAQGVPRLIMIDGDEAPPALIDCAEDWVRLPASQTDIDARCAAILARCSGHGAERPVLDVDGVLRCGTEWVSLPPVEARLLEALLDRFGAVVSRDALSRSGWPAGAPGRNALDVHVLRLRRRIAPLGVVIKTVRSRGYLLERGNALLAVESA
jgi:lactoylglutathione lyase